MPIPDETKLCVPMQELTASLAAAQAEAAALRQRLAACEAEAASLRAQLAAQAPRCSSGGGGGEHATYDALQQQVVQVRAAAQLSVELGLLQALLGQSGASAAQGSPPCSDTAVPQQFAAAAYCAGTSPLTEGCTTFERSPAVTLTHKGFASCAWKLTVRVTNTIHCWQCAQLMTDEAAQQARMGALQQRAASADSAMGQARTN